jgi:hypothetical protein
MSVTHVVSRLHLDDSLFLVLYWGCISVLITFGIMVLRLRQDFSPAWITADSLRDAPAKFFNMQTEFLHTFVRIYLSPLRPFSLLARLIPQPRFWIENIHFGEGLVHWMKKC